MANTNTITNNTQAANPNAALWRIVLSDYQSVEAEYQRLSVEYEAKSAAYQAECGEPNPDFETYGLGRFGNDSREKQIRNVEIAIIIKDYVGTEPSADDFAEIARKAATLVDEHKAYLAHRDEAFARTIGQIDKPWEAALDKVFHARAKLLKTPAPDTSAVIYKLDLLAPLMVENDEEDAEAVSAIRDDARRLFGAA
jgi:hypothetical protein